MNVTDELKTRIDIIEESYELFLAYAAQGVSGEQATKASGQVREFLLRVEKVLPELPDLFRAVVDVGDEVNQERYRAFIDVLQRDASDSLAAIRLVLAQPSISSQMIDNLNASIHLRALLTDVFLVDEMLNPRATKASPS